MELVHPLSVRKVAPHAGKLPRRWGLCEISPANVVLTALNPGPDGTTVLRVYEAEGKSKTDATIQFHAPVTAAWEANLMEDSGRSLGVKKNSVQFDLHPFEIQTIKVSLNQR
jgi:alpha-mannosidase